MTKGAALDWTIGEVLHEEVACEDTEEWALNKDHHPCPLKLARTVKTQHNLG